MFKSTDRKYPWVWSDDESDEKIKEKFKIYSIMRPRNLEKVFMNKKRAVSDNVLSDSIPSTQAQENRLKSITIKNNNLEKKQKR